ncbi:MAG: serine racemase VanT catalytic subunit [Lachnospiraceae bacterium]|nr:serine racemase VanT catalytic subunit [Lachnospiraceae bacterium]
MNQEYRSLDRFRIFAALLIVGIHTAPLSSVNQTLNFLVIHVFARIAVPFFLMVTGYFVLGRMKTPLSFVKKTALIYMGATLIYLPISLRAGHYANGNFLITFLKNIIFDGTFYHLWYLPAAIIGILLAYALLRKFSLNLVIGFTVVLYIIGLFGDSYYGLAAKIPFLESAYEVIFALSSYTRNGIFYAPLFLVMAVLISKQEDRKNVNTHIWKNLAGFIISMTLMLMEGLALNHLGYQRHDSLYITLVPAMYFLFQLLLNCDKKLLSDTTLRNNDILQNNTILRNGAMLRDIALWIYFLHPLFIIVVRGIARFMNLTNLLVENSMVHYLAVCLLSFLCSVFIAILSRIFINKTNLSQKYRIQTKTKVSLKQEVQLGTHRAWCELDMKNLRHNINVLKSHLPEGCCLMPAVKANAYGHGAVEIAKELNACGIRAFCVVTVWEGMELRKFNIKGEILVLGYTHPELFPLLKRYRLTQTVLDYEYAILLSKSKGSKKIPVHLKVDTGMHRMGERSENIDKILAVLADKNLSVTGIYTHLCVADSEKASDIAYTEKQIESFNEVLLSIREQGIKLPKTHVQSSYGVLRGFDNSYDYARVGISLYGMLSNSCDTEKWGSGLKPVLSVKARVAMTGPLYAGEAAGYGLKFTALRDMKIATITIGYGDGIPRLLSDCNQSDGHVLINGSKAPVIGRICMDSLTVDVTDIKDVKSGDVAFIIGKSGEAEITAGDIAVQTGTITNEILSRLGARLEKVKQM